MSTRLGGIPAWILEGPPAGRPGWDGSGYGMHPTDSTKPQQTIQSPDRQYKAAERLYKDTTYQTKTQNIRDNPKYEARVAQRSTQHLISNVQYKKKHIITSWKCVTINKRVLIRALQGNYITLPIPLWYHVVRGGPPTKPQNSIHVLKKHVKPTIIRQDTKTFDKSSNKYRTNIRYSISNIINHIH